MRAAPMRIVKASRLGAALTYAWRRRIGGSATPIYLDVGARGGLPKVWAIAAWLGMIRPFFVEPDPMEARRLSRRYPAAPVLPCALANTNSTGTLHLTKARGLSSLLTPDQRAVSRDGGADPWTVESTVPVKVVRLDAVWRGPPPAFVKVDVQGGELSVLLGMGDLLDGVLCLEVESSFLPFYVGQPPFHELYAVLIARGFDLVKIRPLGLFEGAVIEFNAFFVRRSEHNDALVCWWKRMNDVGSHRRIVAFGY